MEKPPELPDASKLDFSQFHPLDHLPFSSRCKEFYGGGRRHLEIGWDFKWKGDVRRFTLCKIGRHRYTKWWKAEYPGGPMMFAGYSCRDCLSDRRDM